MNRPPNSMRLLLVEDDPDQRELLCQTLGDHFGQQTVIDVDGITKALEQPLETFDLILSDFNLPDGTGMDLLEQVRRRCATPLVLVTSENVGQIAAESIRKGATDYVVKVGDYLFALPLIVEKCLESAKMKRENESLRAELEKALAALRERNAALEKSLRKVEEAAATDPLTGLYNRRHFSKVLSQLFAESQRFETDMSCIMIDLDGYKQLNDSCGHQVGDRILLVAARSITANMRTMDVAARYGGDEFIVLAPRAGSEEAAHIAERIRQEYRQASAMILRRNEGLTMSFGVASLHVDRPESGEQLVACADAALYQAKEAGKNRIVISSAVAGR